LGFIVDSDYLNRPGFKSEWDTACLDDLGQKQPDSRGHINPNGSQDGIRFLAKLFRQANL
jgi:hypothetical protein